MPLVVQIFLESRHVRDYLRIGNRILSFIFHHLVIANNLHLEIRKDIRRWKVILASSRFVCLLVRLDLLHAVGTHQFTRLKKRSCLFKICEKTDVRLMQCNRRRPWTVTQLRGCQRLFFSGNWHFFWNTHLGGNRPDPVIRLWCIGKKFNESR